MIVPREVESLSSVHPSIDVLLHERLLLEAMSISYMLSVPEVLQKHNAFQKA